MNNFFFRYVLDYGDNGTDLVACSQVICSRVSGSTCLFSALRFGSCM